MKKKSKTTAAPAPAASPVSFLDRVRAKLHHLSYESRPTAWLDLGDEHLNSVLGDPALGIFFGQIIELAGKSSAGKSAIAYDLVATAQTKANAVGHWVDFERSFDKTWSARRGVDTENLNLLRPYVGRFSTKKEDKFGKVSYKQEAEDRLITAQELLEEAEACLVEAHAQFPDRPQIIVVDSVAAMLAEEEADAGLSGQNMRTNNALPVMLGKLLRRWIAVLGETQTIGIFLNQLRTKPGMSFGDPDYTVGGNALPFYAHSRVRMRRTSGGRIRGKNGNVSGIKIILRNDKNKAGGVEGHEIGAKILFNGASKFMSVSTIQEEAASSK